MTKPENAEVSRAAAPRIARRLGAFLGGRVAPYALVLAMYVHYFASGTRAAGGDLFYVHYPWADALRLSVLKYHQFPWWNPWAVSGEPLFADPGSIAVFMPEALFVLAFGAVVGLKATIVFYALVGVEGCRALCRHLFGGGRFVELASVIPAIVPALALHYSAGHVVFVVFHLFPWLLLLALTWERSAGRAVALGGIVACFLLSYIHYTVIMSFSIVGVVSLFRLPRLAHAPQVVGKAALVVCTALGLALLRIVTALVIVRQFPRTDTAHYPIAGSLIDVLRALLEPFQDRSTPGGLAGLSWWELGSYVGLPALLLAYEGFRRQPRRLWPLYAGAVACLVLAWNNRDPFFPSYWLHFFGPWKNMLVITRWGLFAAFFLLVGAVHGLVALRRSGRPWLSAALLALVAGDVGFASFYASRGTFTVSQPPFGAFDGPPQTMDDTYADTWAHERQNLVSMGAGCSLLGWFLHRPARAHVGEAGYAGDFVGTKPLVVESWTPNRFVLRAAPSDIVTLNINPSSYWVMNGRRLFPDARAFEIDRPFQVSAPADGRIEIDASPPHATALVVGQLAFLIVAAILWAALRRRERALAES